MSPPRLNSSASASDYNRILNNDACPVCERLLDELNAAFHSVHHFMLANYENRSADDEYLGELGRLIHAQVAARRLLIAHQRNH